MNIFCNYFPNKYVTINDKDLPWMAKATKDKINSKKSLFISKNYIELQKLVTEISDITSMRKEKYYDHFSMKLYNSSISSKTYWSILKSFNKDTKIPLIPPLFVNNKIVSDLTEKVNLFNVFLLPSVHPWLEVRGNFLYFEQFMTHYSLKIC